MSKSVLRRAAAVLAAGAMVLVGSGSGTVVAASGSTAGTMADPDIVQTSSGYVVYATGAKVPAFTTSSLSIGGKRATFNAMPDGPGTWALGCKGVWAPSVVRHGGQYLMFYTATKRASTTCSSSSHGHKCIGVASSPRATGPFRNAREWACPSGGRWAIDPDAFVSGGNLYVVYRDDAVVSHPDTGISAVRARTDGSAIWSTRRTLLTSRSITWESRNMSGTTRVVENPTMIKVGSSWRLFFSGNNWASKRYATGLANCGSGILDNACTPTHRDRPWFGYRGTGGINPIHGLPGNHTGPGGVSAFRTSAGSAKVIWHWWKNPGRPAMTGSLSSSLTVS